MNAINYLPINYQSTKSCWDKETSHKNYLIAVIKKINHAAVIVITALAETIRNAAFLLPNLVIYAVNKLNACCRSTPASSLPSSMRSKTERTPPFHTPRAEDSASPVIDELDLGAVGTPHPSPVPATYNSNARVSSLSGMEGKAQQAPPPPPPQLVAQPAPQIAHWSLRPRTPSLSPLPSPSVVGLGALKQWMEGE